MDSALQAVLPLLQQGLQRSPGWAWLQGILGLSLWVATDQQELILMQDMPLGMETSVLYLCPKGMAVLGLILAIPLILKGSGFLEVRRDQASGGDSSGLPGGCSPNVRVKCRKWVQPLGSWKKRMTRAWQNLAKMLRSAQDI